MTDQQTPVLVVGLGRSGLAAAHLAAADGVRVRVTDHRPEADLADVAATLPPGVETEFGGHHDGCLDGIGRVIVSPGVAANAPLIAAATARGLEVLSEVEFAWLHRPEAPLVAITGSNGKSTVTTLTGEMLAAAGVAVAVGGNLGTAASELVLRGGWDSWVLEVSSFQAEIFDHFAPRVGVFLNLSQDHLERHADMARYAAAKRRLFAHQRPSDAAVLNADDEASATTETVARRRLFSVAEPADGCLDDGRLVIDGRSLVKVGELGVSGLHNVANGLASALAALEMGADRDAVMATLRSFRGLEHRHRTVRDDGDIRWVDDSKATNVGATLAGLAGYPPRSVHLILGGQGKGQDYTPLREAVTRVAARVYLIGEDADTIAADLEGTAPLDMCRRLEEAVRRVRGRATAGQWVLLAPACASFDQFSGYAERGEMFVRLAQGEVAPCR